MSGFLCGIWPYLMGGLLGWLAAGWLARRALARQPATVDRVVNKIVEKPVERIVEKIVDRPVDRAVERVVQVPVDRVVEKVVERVVDNPSHLAQIAALTATAALVPGLRSQLSAAQSATQSASNNAAPQVLEKVVVDSTGMEARDREIEGWRSRYATLQAQMQTQVQGLEQRLANGPAIDLQAARAAGFTLKHEDELEILEGIGPKIADLLRAAGVRRFWQLAQMAPAQIQPILDGGGPNFKLAVPDTWPEQASLAAHNHWRALKSLQDALSGGVRK